MNTYFLNDFPLKKIFMIECLLVIVLGFFQAFSINKVLNINNSLNKSILSEK
jgi:hypothetical protein